MGTLVFVGAGLAGVHSMTLEALDEIRNSDSVFLESYTTFIDGSFGDELHKLTGKKPQNLGRSEVEAGDILLKAAASGRTVLIVGGDSMSATTHFALRIEAAKRGIGTRIFFGPSIFTAAPSLLGLHHYKFGRTVTIPRFQQGYRPMSPFDAMVSNHRAGMHTLCLLDVDAEKGYYMSPGEAFTEISEAGSSAAPSLLNDELVACAVSRAGRMDSSTVTGRIGKMKQLDFGKGPHCIVIPSRLHFQEAEALMVFSGASREDITPLME